jgi:hypothetical protein
MFTIISIMFVGIGIGYVLRNLQFLQKIEKSTSLTIFLLLFVLGNTYPIPIPTNIIDIIVNIAINFYSKTYTTRRFHRMRTIMQYIFHRARVWVG